MGLFHYLVQDWFGCTRQGSTRLFWISTGDNTWYQVVFLVSPPLNFKARQAGSIYVYMLCSMSTSMPASHCSLRVLYQQSCPALSLVSGSLPVAQSTNNRNFTISSTFYVLYTLFMLHRFCVATTMTLFHHIEGVLNCTGMKPNGEEMSQAELELCSA